MKKHRSFHCYLFMILSACMSLSWAQDTKPVTTSDAEFSFVAPSHCKMPPKAPPDSLLRRKFKVAYLTFDVHVLDVNGDGICDWLREGFVEMVHDLEPGNNLRLDNFLFLGTLKGWRRINPLRKQDYQLISSSDYWRLIWPFLPIAAVVYQKNQVAPYVIGFRELAPGFGSLLNLNIGLWDSTYESFKEVDDDTRKKILAFLAKSLCREGVETSEIVKDSPWSGAYTLADPGYGDQLCQKKQ